MQSLELHSIVPSIALISVLIELSEMFFIVTCLTPSASLMFVNWIMGISIKVRSAVRLLRSPVVSLIDPL